MRFSVLKELHSSCWLYRVMYVVATCPCFIAVLTIIVMNDMKIYLTKIMIEIEIRFRNKIKCSR